MIFQAGHLWWLWLAVAVAAAAGVVLLYRYERRLVAARIGNTLLILRLAVVAVLFFALLQPVLAVVRPQAGENRILIAIDASQSMQTSDPHASDEEKLRWARALGTIEDASARSAQDSQESLQHVLEAVGKLPRREIVQRLLLSTSNPLLEELQRTSDVRVELFADKAVSIDAESLSLADDAVAALGLNRGITDLQAALTADRSTGEAAPTAIVLFTDGRDTSSHDPAVAARASGRDGVPIFPVMIGSPSAPVDITIAGVDHPASVFLSDTPRLNVSLASGGFEGSDIDVELRPSIGEPLRQTVRVEAATTNVHFDWPAAVAGRHSLTVAAAPQPGELTDENNAAEFAMTVVDDTIRVLLIEEEARWEFRFIDNAYRRDSRVDVSQIVFEQPFMNVLETTFFPSKLDWPADPDQWDKSALAETDIVIVGDVSQQHMTADAWETLERYVDAGRGTLVLLAGKNFSNGGDLPPALERLLPLSDLRVIHFDGDSTKASPTERGFHLALTPEGEKEPMLQFATDAELNRQIWQEFPGHTWGMTGTPKPGASVLAEIVPPSDSKTSNNEDRAAVVRQPYGLGQVLWLGMDSTWRWRHRTGDRYHHRFWGQLARWAAQHRSLGGSGDVKFGFERTDITHGETTIVRALFSRVFLERFPQVQATAEIVAAGDTQPMQTVSLQPAAGRPLAYEGRATDLPPGEYTARLKIEGADANEEDLTASLFVSPPAIRELADLSADEELLSQIAALSGGRMIGPDDISDLPRQLVSPQAARDVGSEVLLWCHPLLLVLVCVLLTAEWVLRKRNGLP